ncbi:hypothetical protein [Emticicia soli]|uniref:Uncharacterized protein n=1 Tax=Emticicia soli TaxID=2027878 RepID=A0ABW5JC26_9BACT
MARIAWGRELRAKGIACVARLYSSASERGTHSKAKSMEHRAKA